MKRRTLSHCRQLNRCATGSASAYSDYDHPIAASQRLAGVCPCESPSADRRQPTAPHGLTLVEMLIAMAITLVMMAAVVTLFANVSNSVRNRRATIELSGQMRHVRNMLQQDLQGATCPGQTWQRPESNHGYIELIEGQYREGDASGLLYQNGDALPVTPTEQQPRIDYKTSILPSSNLVFADTTWTTDGGGLGDYDDILMLTVRNEHEPFVGRVPPIKSGATDSVRRISSRAESFNTWGHETVESPLAEVVWFAIENPGFTNDSDVDDEVTNFFGEPGMRTIYRRTLLIAPWLNPYRFTDNNGNITDTFTDGSGGTTFKAEPGLLRILSDGVDADTLDQALAALVAFQDRYDISARLEFDPRLGGDGRWKIVANTLGDLTKRENRFSHFGLFANGTTFSRLYPFPLISAGSGYSGSSADIVFVSDRDIGAPSDDAQAVANVDSGTVTSFTVNAANFATPGDRRYTIRPLAYVDGDPTTAATAQAVLNDLGQVICVVHGPAPLWGSRRGEDVMLTDALAFDIRVYDPGAPLFGHSDTGTVLEPTDPAWAAAYIFDPDNSDGTNSLIGRDATEFPFVGQGAYVDMGYGLTTLLPSPTATLLPLPSFANPSATLPWFFDYRPLHDVYMSARARMDEPLSYLAPGYAVYDTWSFHYENNGINEDEFPVGSTTAADTLIDQGTNGLDSPGHYSDNPVPPANIRLGVDDVGERETIPPYDRPLRGVQVLMRAYERDSRQIRQVRVNQHFMQE